MKRLVAAALFVLVACKEQPPPQKPVEAPAEEKHSCELGLCKVQVITAATAAELSAQNARVPVRLEFREGTTDEQLKASLDKVPWLTWLNVGMAKKLTTLAPVASLKSLTYLYAGGNPNITDVTPLSGLQLQELALPMTGVSDLSPLKSLAKLERLNLYAAKSVTDLSPLTGMSLRSLNLYMVKPADWAPVATLATLEYLNVAFSDLKSLQTFAKLPALKELDASWCKELADIKAVAEMKSLQRFSCIDCPITHIKPLEGLTNLTYVSVAGTPVTDLSPLAALPALQGLDLQRSKVKSLDPLKKLKKLGSVYAMETELKDFSALQASADAKSLYYVSAPKAVSAEKLAALKTASPQLKIDVAQ